MNGPPVCECGCGRLTKRSGAGGWCRFLNGHQNRTLRQARKAERWRVEDRGYETPCWIWQLHLTAKGYGQEWDRGRGRMNFAHRIAYERAFGPIAAQSEIDHRCQQRACVNPDHLDVVKHFVNIARGKPRKRLSAATVRRIRELLALGLSQAEIARAVNVSQVSVSRVSRGVTPESRRH